MPTGITENSGGILIGHAFQAHEQDHLPLLQRKLRERAFELKHLARSRGISRGRQRHGYRLYIDRSGFSNISPNIINVLVVHDREQPGPKISARLPEFFLDKCAAERVLHQIVCPLAIARERPRIASQSRDLLFDESMKFGQFALSLGARTMPDGRAYRNYVNL